jgi:hypothetical protein
MMSAFLWPSRFQRHFKSLKQFGNNRSSGGDVSIRQQNVRKVVENELTVLDSFLTEGAKIAGQQILIFLILTIFLRQENSAESKPLSTDDGNTGEANK